ncbi:MAG: hypothetical protein ACK5LK_06320 [Chthoniobacterales bacterium]
MFVPISVFKSLFKALSLLLIAVVVTACDSPEATLDTVQREVAAYEKAPTPEKKATIEASFEKLDKQIDQLNQSGKTIEAKGLKDRRDRAMTEFKQAQFNGAVDQVGAAVKKITGAIKQAGESFSDTLNQDQPDDKD